MEEAYPTMLDDPIRMQGLRRGMAAVIRPGDVVVDVGCAMGACCVYAAELGAARVFAIDCDPIIDVAKEVAARAGYADRIEFFEAYSTDVTLPEPADIVFFEDYSSFLIHEGLDEILADSRARFLKPGGRIAPGIARMFAAPFEDRRFQKRVDRWGAGARYLHGLDFSTVREMKLNSNVYHYLQADQLLAEPVLLRELDMQTVTDTGLAVETCFTATRPGTVHGVALWFEIEFAPGVVLSNAPGLPPTVWEQGAFPLERPLTLAAGEPLWVDIRTVRSETYGFFWNWTVRTGPRERGLPDILRQSSFRSDPLPRPLAHALTFL